MTDPKRKKADIVSVARAAGVSPSTVSRYFNHPELLKAKTKRRIDSAVRRLGYIRNRAAQTIHGIRSGTIGVLVPTLDHAIFAEVVQAFSDTVSEHGFTILLASHGYSQEREYAILRKFLEHRVDGVALTGLDHNEDVFQLIESQAIPAILLWNHEAESRLPCVGADNRLAGHIIAEHVLNLGHRDIACMFPPTDGNDRARDRQVGVMAAIEAAGVAVPDDWQLTTVYSISASKRDVTALLSAQQRPTALICGNDILATGALYGAAAAGVAIPRDLTVVGIGDFRGSRDIEPPLTTVRLPARRIGVDAGHALARAIVQSEIKFESGHCAPELLVRGSSSRPA